VVPSPITTAAEPAPATRRHGWLFRMASISFVRCHRSRWAL
jgi:hypothetical protein